MTNNNLSVHPLSTFNAYIPIPGDKSITHRALILGAMARNTSIINNALYSEDIRHLVSCLRQLGVTVCYSGPNQLTITGKGSWANSPPTRALYVGNSGTAMRLMLGYLSTHPTGMVLYGDQSLNSRPMCRVISPLQMMGGRFLAGFKGTKQCAPVMVCPSRLHGMDYTLSVSSAQVKSSVLIAAMKASGVTRVTDPFGTRNHTEIMLRQFGGYCETNGRTIVVDPNKSNLTGQELMVPGDFSAAAFFIVLACIVPNSQLLLEQVGLNPTRTGLITVLRRMGANISIARFKNSGEPVGDIIVKSSRLKACFVAADEVTSMIDEFPILFIAACFASGRSVFYGLQELRVKESDRIASMVFALRKMGVSIDADAHNVQIEGGTLRPATVDACDDHRIAMALCIAFLASKSGGSVINTAQIDTSFPTFVSIVNGIKNNSIV